MRIDEGNEPMELATHPRPRARTRSAAVVVAVCLLLGACGDDGEASGEEDDTKTTTTDESTPTTQPPGTDPEAVQPIVEDLVVELGELHDEMGQTPSLVTDPEADVADRLRALYAPTSEDVDRILDAYETHAANGSHYEAIAGGEPTYRTEILGEVQEVDENTVEFYTCTTYHHRLVGSSQGGETLDGMTHPGQGTAKRVDGVWLIEHTVLDDSQACPEAEGA